MSRLVSALLVTAAFALVGWAVAGVTVSGALAGFFVAFLLFYGVGWRAFVVLLAVFVITWITTRLGHSRKQRLGVAERRRGRRSAGQVLANIGVSGAFAALVILQSTLPHISPVFRDVGLWIAASVAALAEAAADTCSSECGEAFSDTAFLIPHFRVVPAGTDGAITLFGTLSGFAASSAIAATVFALGLLHGRAAWIAGISGGFGMVVDTLLGATLERRGILNNNSVNFSSTLASAILALILGISLR